MNNPPYIIAGMHRSGTSLLARLLCELGFDLGNNLFAGDSGNPDGYYEDKPAVAINRSILRAAVSGSSEGWPDWGWSTEYGFNPREACKLYRSQAHDYLKYRTSASVYRSSPWGWKDPRNSLLLQFWLSMAPQARVIAIYRAPWDVTSALQRVRPPIFLANPDWCLPLWRHYNNHLLEFSQRHPSQCLLLHARTLASDPAVLPRLLKQKWGLECPHQSLTHLVRSERLSTLNEKHPLITLYNEIFPEITFIYSALQKQSELPSPTADMSSAKLCLNCRPDNPALAIIIPTHNQGDLLLEAIASAEEQVSNIRHHAVELVVVDDGSTDSRSKNILGSLKSLGYRVISQHNQGLSAARNTGLTHTVAPIILPLDDDNYLLPGYLQKGLSIMLRNPGLAVLYGDREDFGLIRQRFRPGPRGYSEMRKINRVDACALIRRSWINACGGYDLSLTAMEDWDLWLGIQKRGGRMAYLPEPCFAYRHRPNSMIRRHFGSSSLQEEVITKLRRKHGQDVWSSS